MSWEDRLRVGTHSLTQSLNPLTHSLTHSLSHSTHSLTHSLVYYAYQHLCSEWMPDRPHLLPEILPTLSPTPSPRLLSPSPHSRSFALPSSYLMAV